MPSVTQDPPTTPSPSCKKRKLDDTAQLYAALVANFPPAKADHPVLEFYRAANCPRTGLLAGGSLDHATLSPQHHFASPLAGRKINPASPWSKRQRIAPNSGGLAEGDPMQRSPSNSPAQRHQRPSSPLRGSAKTAGPGEKTRSATVAPQTSTPTPIISQSLMSRCHICSRKPTKKSELDSFTDCQGCGRRTCYICIRECLGWGPPATMMNHAQADSRAPPTPTLPQEPSFTMVDIDLLDDNGNANDIGTDNYHQRILEQQQLALLKSQQQAQQQPQLRLRQSSGNEGREGRAEAGRGFDGCPNSGGGHRQRVCSRCCVERGEDGEVACLGCLPFVEG